MIPALTLMLGTYILFRVVVVLDTYEGQTGLMKTLAAVAIIAALGAMAYNYYAAIAAGEAINEGLRTLGF